MKLKMIHSWTNVACIYQQNNFASQYYNIAINLNSTPCQSSDQGKSLLKISSLTTKQLSAEHRRTMLTNHFTDAL